jgi:hypothetical protein
VAGKKKQDCKLTPGKQWGGKRARSPVQSKWKSGKATKALYVPESLAPAIIAYARKLDAGEDPVQEIILLQDRLTRAERKWQQIEPLLNHLERMLAKSVVLNSQQPLPSPPADPPSSLPEIIVLQDRLTRAETKLRQVERFLNNLDLMTAKPTANGQKVLVHPAGNLSVSDQKPPRSVDVVLLLRQILQSPAPYGKKTPAPPDASR